MSEEKRDYKAIAETNILIAHAKDIQAICKERNVDIGVGAEMWMVESGQERTPENMAALKEFRALCVENPLMNIVAELEK